MPYKKVKKNIADLREGEMTYCRHSGRYNGVSYTDRSVRDHSQRVIVMPDVITVQSFVGRSKASEYNIMRRDWVSLEHNPMCANLNWSKSQFSPRSKSSDESQSNLDTIEPDDPRVESWLRDQGRMDVRGIDTPRKSRSKGSKKPVRKAKRTGKTETQIRGLR